MPIHLTASQVLRMGLRFVGQDDHVQARRSESTRKDDSHSFYGTGPDVASIVFSDLQTTAVAAARVAPDELDLHSCVMALHFLKIYPTGDCKSTTFKGNPKTCREWCWWHCQKIRMLKESKIVWPTEWDDTDPDYDPDNIPTSLLSVDGVHCRMFEPWHPRLVGDETRQEEGVAASADVLGVVFDEYRLLPFDIESNNYFILEIFFMVEDVLSSCRRYFSMSLLLDAIVFDNSTFR